MSDREQEDLVDRLRSLSCSSPTTAFLERFPDASDQEKITLLAAATGLTAAAAAAIFHTAPADASPQRILSIARDALSGKSPKGEGREQHKNDFSGPNLDASGTRPKNRLSNMGSNGANSSASARAATSTPATHFFDPPASDSSPHPSRGRSPSPVLPPSFRLGANSSRRDHNPRSNSSPPPPSRHHRGPRARSNSPSAFRHGFSRPFQFPAPSVLPPGVDLNDPQVRVAVDATLQNLLHSRLTRSDSPSHRLEHFKIKWPSHNPEQESFRDFLSILEELFLLTTFSDTEKILQIRSLVPLSTQKFIRACERVDDRLRTDFDYFAASMVAKLDGIDPRKHLEVFRTMRQKDTESVTEYAVRVRTQFHLAFPNFPADDIDQQLSNKLVESVSCPDVAEKLLDFFQEQFDNYDRIVRRAQTFETNSKARGKRKALFHAQLPTSPDLPEPDSSPSSCPMPPSSAFFARNGITLDQGINDIIRTLQRIQPQYPRQYDQNRNPPAGRQVGRYQPGRSNNPPSYQRPQAAPAAAAPKGRGYTPKRNYNKGPQSNSPSKPSANQGAGRGRGRGAVPVTPSTPGPQRATPTNPTVARPILHPTRRAQPAAETQKRLRPGFDHIDVSSSDARPNKAARQNFFHRVPKPDSDSRPTGDELGLPADPDFLAGYEAGDDDANGDGDDSFDQEYQWDFDPESDPSEDAWALDEGHQHQDSSSQNPYDPWSDPWALGSQN